MQRRRERVVDQLPVRLLCLNGDARHVQLAVAHIADRMVRSTWQQASTPPKKVEPDTASFPAGALPETCTLLAPAGSLLTTVMVADFAPKLVGWKRIGRSSDMPAAMISG